MSVTHTQIATWADEFLRLKNEIATMESLLEGLKEKLQTAVPAGTEFSGDGRRVIHSLTTTMALNQALLKEKAPETYTAFCERREGKRLTVR